MSKIRSITVIAFILVAVAPALAPAADSPLKQFFRNFEGHWEGDGVFTQFNPDGTRAPAPYQIQIDVIHDGSAWQATVMTTVDGAPALWRTTEFYVADDQLWVGKRGHLVPVDVLNVDSHDISYRLEVRNAWTGRTDVMTYRLLLTDHSEHGVDPSAPRTLHSHDTDEAGGTLVTEDEFDVKRVAQIAGAIPHPSAASRSR